MWQRERLFRPEKLRPDNEMLSEARKIYASNVNEGMKPSFKRVG